ncbi:hypothetical protein GGR51DRAFT_202426 [Nemania sp. FL0031]|nr:hypothetical protein GGR51DRAFT_202426 [Nemania sp. FL0031]
MSNEKGVDIAAKNDEIASSSKLGAKNSHDLPQYTKGEAPTYKERDTTVRMNVPDIEGSSSGPARSGSPAPNYRAVSILRSNEFFTAIHNGDHESINAMLGTGYASAGTKNYLGKTPLLAAVEGGHINTVRLLLEKGADPNEFGMTWETPAEMERTWRTWDDYHDTSYVSRTPLQLAAAQGNIAIVKLLMETYAADDKLIAPDGELALRLAAAGGHREIVAYLPARRGGGFRRWKKRHSVAVARMKYAAKGIGQFAEFFAWKVPRFFVWSIPKHVLVIPVVEGVKWLHRHRAEIPRMILGAVGCLLGAIKGFPVALFYVTKGLVSCMAHLTFWLCKGIVKTIAGVPKATGLALQWMFKGVKTLLKAIWSIINRLVSFLHTAIVAVATFFKTVTLKDVWRGFVAFVRAVVVDLPTMLWGWARKFGHTAVKMLDAIWGFTGQVIACLFYILASVVTFVPRELWEILVSVFKSLGFACKEFMIFLNPKRV